MRKLRLKEVKSLAQIHPVSKWKCEIWDWGCFSYKKKCAFYSINRFFSPSDLKDTFFPKKEWASVEVAWWSNTGSQAGSHIDLLCELEPVAWPCVEHGGSGWCSAWHLGCDQYAVENCWIRETLFSLYIPDSRTLYFLLSLSRGISGESPTWAQNPVYPC